MQFIQALIVIKSILPHFVINGLLPYFYSYGITANRQGFLLCWNSVLNQPEQKPIEKRKLKITTKSIRRITSSWILADSDMKIRIYSSASIAANRMLF
jgi:hypothetical protein